MKNFLRKFLPPFAGSGLSATVAPEEPLSRFLFDGSHFAAERGRVKPRAFEPAREENRTSVFRTRGLGETGIWRLGDDYVAPLRGKPVRARADIPAGKVMEAKLCIVPDDTPPRHANIGGWPTEKHAWMHLAQKLAAEARLVMKPDTQHRSAA